MRADQWLMVGVVGLGAYAVYRMVTNSPADAKQLPVPTGNIPAGVLTVGPQRLTPLVADPGAPIGLRASRPYFGYLVGSPVSDNAAAAQLAGLGLENLRFFHSRAEAQDAGFPAPLLDHPGFVAFYGRYLGANQTRPMPANAKIWEGTVGLSGIPAAVAGFAYAYRY